MSIQSGAHSNAEAAKLARQDAVEKFVIAASYIDKRLSSPLVDYFEFFWADIECARSIAGLESEEPKLRDEFLGQKQAEPQITSKSDRGGHKPHFSVRVREVAENLFQNLNKFLRLCGDILETPHLPSLHRGRHQGIGLNGVSAECVCAIIIAEAWYGIHKEYPKPNSTVAATAAQILWSVFPRKHIRFGNEPSNEWRDIFWDAEKIEADNSFRLECRHIAAIFEAQHAYLTEISLLPPI